MSLMSLSASCVTRDMSVARVLHSLPRELVTAMSTVYRLVVGDLLVGR